MSLQCHAVHYCSPINRLYSRRVVAFLGCRNSGLPPVWAGGTAISIHACILMTNRLHTAADHGKLLHNGLGNTVYSHNTIGCCHLARSDSSCPSTAGFLQQFAAVCHPDRSETNMAAVLKELSGGQTPNRVICCGHSLGGALATLGQWLCDVHHCDCVVLYHIHCTKDAT